MTRTRRAPFGGIPHRHFWRGWQERSRRDDQSSETVQTERDAWPDHRPQGGKDRHGDRRRQDRDGRQGCGGAIGRQTDRGRERDVERHRRGRFCKRQIRRHAGWPDRSEILVVGARHGAEIFRPEGGHRHWLWHWHGAVKERRRCVVGLFGCFEGCRGGNVQRDNFGRGVVGPGLIGRNIGRRCRQSLARQHGGVRVTVTGAASIFADTVRDPDRQGRGFECGGRWPRCAGRQNRRRRVRDAERSGIAVA